MNNIHAFLKPVLLVNLYLAPIVLFLHSAGLFFPYVTTKAFFFFVVAEIAFACWALLAIRDKKYRFKPNFLFYAFLAFILITFLADLIGLNFYKSFWSNSERMDGFLMQAHVFLFFTALLGTFRTKKSWDYYLKYVLGMITLVGIASVVKEWEAISNVSTHRLSSHLGNPIYMATVSTIGIFMSGFFFFKEKITKKTLWKKAGYLSIILFLIYVIFLTGTRGALVGVAFGLFAFCVSNFFTEKESKGLKYLSGVGILVFIISISSFFFLKDDLAKTDLVQSSNLLKRTFNISADDRTTRNRLATWEIALEGFKEKPLLGHGRESYEYLFSKYYIPEKLYDAETWFDRSHNVHLDKLAFSGVFGFMAYLAMYFFAFKLIWTRKGINNRQKSALTALLVGHFVQGSFVFESVSSYVVMASVFGYIGYSPEHESGKVSDNFRKDFWAMMVVLVALVLSLLFFVAKPYSVNKTFLKALLYSNISPSINLENCPKIYQIRKNDIMTKFGKNYCRDMENLDYDAEKKSEPIVDLIDDALYSKTFMDKEILEKMMTDTKILRELSQESLNRLDQVINNEMVGLIQKYPKNNKLITYYSAYLIRTGRIDSAGSYVNLAYDLGPEKFSNINTKAELYIRQDSRQKAINLLEEALEKGPNNISQQLLKAIEG